jgi:hypothetical protein
MVENIAMAGDEFLTFLDAEQSSSVSTSIYLGIVVITVTATITARLELRFPEDRR